MTDEKSQEPSMELILYRIGEMSGKIDSVAVRVDAYQQATNDKLSAITTDLAVTKALTIRDEKDKEEEDRPKVDMQKLMLAALTIISGAIAVISKMGSK